MNDVDLDRLADFLGGALDGTPDEAEVRRLVSTEPAWADAYARLIVADEAVVGDLGALVAASEPMPADVADRLDAALAGAVAGLGTAAPGRRDDRGAPRSRPGGTTGPDAGRPGEGPGRTSRSGRRGWKIAVAAVAAAVVVLVCVGAVSRLGGHSIGTSNSRGDLPAAGPAKAGGAEQRQTFDAAQGQPVQLATGTDYTPATLGTLVALGRAAAGGSAQAVAGSIGSAATEPRRPTATSGTPVPPGEQPRIDADSLSAGGGAATGELSPLAAPGALGRCTEAVVRRHGGTVVVVDYASFQGRPALILVVSGVAAANGRPYLVVVGPECGSAGTVDDERYTTAG